MIKDAIRQTKGKGVMQNYAFHSKTFLVEVLKQALLPCQQQNQGYFLKGPVTRELRSFVIWAKLTQKKLLGIYHF